MLRILERVAGPNTRSGGRGSITKRLRSNRVELFEGVTGVAPSVAEYWMEAMERIMDDLDFTLENKLKGVVSLLRDEAYLWWLTVKEGTQPEQLTWDFYKSFFQGKYVVASYIDTRRCEFLNLTQGDRSVAECEAQFLRLSHYARGMVATEYEHCVRFEDALKDNLRVLIALQRERYFLALVEKAKITEKVKCIERKNLDKERGKNKRGSEPLSSAMRPKKKVRSGGPVRVGALVAPTGITFCGHYERRHPSECWKTTRACLRCGSTKHLARECPLRADQVQAMGSGIAQPSGVVQQPPRCRGQARGGNGMGRGQRALGRGVGQAEARKLALVYASRRREDRDAPDVITGTFFIFDLPYTTLIDLGSTYSSVVCSVPKTIGISVESSSSEVTILRSLGQS
ncbi:uncharacterized protein LOC105765458 [Gossypium raimondii]|uniref:uncharacterized protein LOC105765458 n=1 Tax=Gossypium raimondii TaxID=29730 RepID=UPI00063AECF9|nr:uncharacterized protein LOC105765458 [Gossypium raimondii]